MNTTLPKLPETAVTFRDIAQCEGLNEVYLQQLSRKDRNWPKPIAVIGRTKIFDWRKIRAYFAGRQKKAA